MNADAASLPGYLWIIGFACTLLGLALYLFASIHRAGHKRFYTWMVLAWLFIPIFPLVFILAAFPGSTTEGELWKFKVGGAFASYVLLWFGGIQLTGRGVDADEERKRVAKLEEISAYVTIIKPIVDEGKKPRPLLETDEYAYRVDGTDRHVRIITGDLASIRGIDVWVNSENTNMQMARFGERSISSTIRYLGAKKDPVTGMVTEDTIAGSLTKKLGKVGQVAAGFVIVADPGELAGSNGVKHIFHVASVAGEQGTGYRPIGRIQDCVTHCLKKADDTTALPDRVTSILFPLMGTGSGQGHLEETVERLIKAAITYLLQHDATRVEDVYFLAYSDLDLAICQKVLVASDKVSRLA